jgi:DNA-binding NarL/FixJ family response regulator
MEKIRVFLADDQQLFLEGVQTVLELKDPSIEIVGAAANGKETLEKIRAAHPDILLLDVKMPIMDGPETVKRIRAREKKPEKIHTGFQSGHSCSCKQSNNQTTHPPLREHSIFQYDHSTLHKVSTSSRNNHHTLKIFMFTTYYDHDLIKRAIDSGADGYFLKDTTIEHLIAVIHEAVGRRHEISLDGGKRTEKNTTAETPFANMKGTPKQLMALSPRERQVFALLIEGKTNTAIAEELNISEKTVRNHVSRIYHILKVKNRSQALIWAINEEMFISY